jgi:hypothetical protein
VERRIAFNAPCPFGHVSSFDWPVEELRAELQAGTLRLECFTCEREFWATAELERSLKKRIAESED